MNINLIWLISKNQNDFERETCRRSSQQEEEEVWSWGFPAIREKSHDEGEKTPVTLWRRHLQSGIKD